jgi:hypothetical protein
VDKQLRRALRGTAGAVAIFGAGYLVAVAIVWYVVRWLDG